MSVSPSNTAITNTENSQTDNGLITPDIRRAVEEAQIFVSYIAWQEDIEFDPNVLKTLINSKYLIREGKWSAEKEIEFWINFDKIADLVSPVTIDSLKTTLPNLGKDKANSKPKLTEAAKAVRRYRYLAFYSLFFLLLFQIYWFIGMDLTRNLNDLFEKRGKVGSDIRQIETLSEAQGGKITINNSTLPQLQKDYKILDQRLDANYEILRDWNRVWLFSSQFDSKITPYNAYKYTEREKRIKENTLVTEHDIEEKITTKKVGESLSEKEVGEKVRRLNLEKALDEARNRLFLNQLSAEFVLRALQSYLLPLLYGLLGATTYVLRTLSTEIKHYTYSYHSEIRFRLRLSLGSLAGMIVGWFISPQDLAGLASLGPMTIAFLTGYNVDILFSLMDKLVRSINKQIKPGQINKKTDLTEEPTIERKAGDEPSHPAPSPKPKEDVSTQDNKEGTTEKKS